MKNNRVTEAVIVGLYAGAGVSVDGATVVTFVSAENSENLDFVISVPADANALAPKLVQATDDSGTNVKDIPGKALTNDLTAGGNFRLSIESSDLDTNNGFTHVGLDFGAAAARPGVVCITAEAFADYNPAMEFIESV